MNNWVKKVFSLTIVSVFIFILTPGLVAQDLKLQTEPLITVGIGDISALDTTVVSFAGYDWYVIGYNGTGVVSSPSTITLLEKCGMGISQFGMNNEYYGSVLQSTVNDIFSHFDEENKKLMIGRTLDEIEGETPSDQKLWPLSTSEAQALSEDIRKLDVNNYWWLRSSGYSIYRADMVSSSGVVYSNGHYGSFSFVIRPAVQLDMTLADVTYTDDGKVKLTARNVGDITSETENKSKKNPKTGTEAFPVSALILIAAAAGYAAIKIRHE